MGAASQAVHQQRLPDVRPLPQTEDKDKEISELKQHMAEQRNEMTELKAMLKQLMMQQMKS